VKDAKLRRQRNEKIRAELFEAVRAMNPGTKLVTAKLAEEYSRGPRCVSSYTISNMLKELSPEEVRPVKVGVWERCAA
jgi:hypothetical protein